MTATLPQGLINPTATEQQTFAQVDTDVDSLEVIRRFWRVYAIQSDASHDAASTRCRNLFWRLWSSPNLARSIASATLMRLLHQCSLDFDMTPIGDTIDLPPLRSSDDSAQNLLTIHPGASSSSHVSETSSNLQRRPPASQSQGPSLHDFRFPSAPGQVGQLRRQSSARTPASVHPQSDDTSGSTSNTTSESGSKPALTRSASSGRQRLPVLATAGKSRTRPQLPRRKSSSQKPAVGSSTTKSPKGSPETTRAASGSRESSSTAFLQVAHRNPPPGLLNPPASTNPAAFALPLASSWQSVDSGTENLPMATTAPQPLLGDLVDPGFRGKFAESQKKLSSVTNLTGLGRLRKSGSVVRFADEIPEDLRKGKEKEGLPPVKDESVEASHRRVSTGLKASLPDEDDDDDDEDSEDSEDDEVDEEEEEDDDDDDDGPQLGLPRTKSHLSLLIKHRRDQTGSLDLGPQPPSEAAKPKSKERSKEEELLSMGRRDGVTKAGGVQVPRQQRVTEQDDPGYQSSSSPEPLF